MSDAQDTRPPRDDAAPIDTLIIGDGALGRWTALTLAERDPDRHVVMVAPAEGRGAASRAAGAMLGCFGEVTTDTLADPPGQDRFAIGLAAHRRWPEVLQRLRGWAGELSEELHHVPDTYVVLNSCGSAMDSENFLALRDALERFDEPHDEVDPTRVPGMRPRPDGRPLRALHLPYEGAVDGRQVLRLIGWAAARAGVEHVDAAVTELRADDDTVVVRTDDGRQLIARQVVVAAGAVSGRLLESALGEHAVMPVLAGAGQAVVARRVVGEPFTSVVRTTNRSGACGLHLVPLPQGREYLGATNVLFAEPELDTYLGVGHFVVGCAVTQLDEQVFLHRVHEWRMGNRPVPLDGYPLLGPTAIPLIHALTGTYRDGFHAAPVLAEHTADQLLGGAGTLDVTRFAPQRAPISTGSVDAAVAEYVRHLEAGWFEAGASQPLHTSTRELATHFDREARALYRDRLGDTIGLGPDVLMFLLASRKSPMDVDRIAAYLDRW